MATKFLRVEEGGTRASYKMHSLVVFSILDHYKRRKEDQDYVVGALLGYKDEQNPALVHITNCFPCNTHAPQKDQIVIDVVYHDKMYELYQRVNKKEVIVGWYSTAEKPNFISSVIFEFFRQPDLVHVTVDVALTQKSLAIRAYIPSIVRAGVRKVLARFEPVPLDFITHESEKIAVDAMILGDAEDEDSLDSAASLLSDIDYYTRSLKKLIHALNIVDKYVAKAQDGSGERDPGVGRLVAHAVGSVPVLRAEAFDPAWNEDMQDLLALVYLANLTKAHLALADKVNKLLV